MPEEPKKTEEVKTYSIEDVDKKFEEFGNKLQEKDNLIEELKEKVENLSTSKEEEKETPKGDQAILDNIQKINERLEATDLKFNTNIVNEEVSKYSKGDKEITEKILLEFERYNPTETSPEQIRERVQTAAQIISNKEDKPSIMDNIQRGSSPSLDEDKNKGTKEVTDNAQKIGRTLGVKPDDYKNEKFDMQKYKDETGQI